MLSGEEVIVKYGASFLLSDGEKVENPVLAIDEKLGKFFYVLMKDQETPEQDENHDWVCRMGYANEDLALQNIETGKITEIYKRVLDNTES